MLALNMGYLLILATWIVAGGGAFLGAYLRKKGENLATHEDLDKLVQQMAAVTETTKSIEANISQETWDRQRRWEMKRDALFAVTGELQMMENAIGKLHAAYRGAKDSAHPDTYLTPKSEAIDKWNETSVRLDTAQVQAELVCQKGVRQAVQAASLLFKKQGIDILEGNLAGYLTSLPDLAAASSKVSQEIRRELGIDESLATAASQK